jgi:hypothetical protein
MKLTRMTFNGMTDAIEAYGDAQSMAIDEINALKERVAKLEHRPSLTNG